MHVHIPTNKFACVILVAELGDSYMYTLLYMYICSSLPPIPYNLIYMYVYIYIYVGIHLYMYIFVEVLLLAYCGMLQVSMLHVHCNLSLCSVCTNVCVAGM